MYRSILSCALRQLPKNGMIYYVPDKCDEITCSSMSA
jgi:hypothetical protein